MKLTKFRVRNFRSVEDSGWIEVDEIASLIGINESGKSNLLVPLWKLNPARGGEVNPKADYPRALYNDMRLEEKKPIFIEAEFVADEGLAQKLAAIAGEPAGKLTRVLVRRDFAGLFYVSFPDASAERTVSRDAVLDLLAGAQREIDALAPATKSEGPMKEAIQTAIQHAIDAAGEAGATVDAEFFEPVCAEFQEVDLSEKGARSAIEPRFGRLIDDLKALHADVSKPLAGQVADARKLVVNELPKFIYYSNYGNLDSEIYLPHVIANMERKNLGSKEEAKARTLKVLFDFVKLDPQEILDLGQEGDKENAEEIKKASERKQERDILMQSASTKLTESFRDWWKQGEYRFRFAADGDHFRIWVSDDKRPDDIELEGRSTGLQWFLSFFLVFLVEADDEHKGAILLLDEPGLTLHPLAQRSLSVFFDNLAKSNQIVFSTHSPFMVDADRLDRVKAVFTNDRGKTSVSSDLRAGASKSVREKSIYAAHAALGLSVSDVILQGCQAVVVEGPSDQYYLTAIKNYLIGCGVIAPRKELVFVPAGGVRGVKAVAALVSAKEAQLPFVVLDADKAGVELKQHLAKDLYAGQSDRLLVVSDLHLFQGAEIEDLMPVEPLTDIFSRRYRAQETDFSEVVDPMKAIVPQMEAFAKANRLQLEEGWKVELAKEFKRRMEQNVRTLNLDEAVTSRWAALFAKLMGTLNEVSPGLAVLRSESHATRDTTVPPSL